MMIKLKSFGAIGPKTNGKCSLVEFIQTSSVGEFRKRLQLLFSFLGQMSIGSSLGTYSRLVSCTGYCIRFSFPTCLRFAWPSEIFIFMIFISKEYLN